MFSISYEIFLSDEGNFKVVFIFVRLRNLSVCHLFAMNTECIKKLVIKTYEKISINNCM